MSDYKLDDIEFYTNVSYQIPDGEWVEYDWTDNVEFSDDDDALDWVGDFDKEAIANAFKLNSGTANAPWAGLESIYLVAED